nr:hypothetical protein CFP56_72565 [Quercus suber]
MGQKHNNRKRTRHRSLHGARRPGPILTMEVDRIWPAMTNTMSRMCEPSTSGIPFQRNMPCAKAWSSCPCSTESAAARDQRIFGESDEDEKFGDFDDLRGPMLDVVLGLFDGIDYDDGGI